MRHIGATHGYKRHTLCSGQDADVKLLPTPHWPLSRVKNDAGLILCLLQIYALQICLVEEKPVALDHRQLAVLTHMMKLGLYL